MGNVRYWIALMVAVQLSHAAYAQDVNELFFDEASVSFNRTHVANGNTENRNGLGIGLYHSFLPKKKVNLVFGIEYNRTNQFKFSMYEGHYAHATSLTYKINSVTFPAGIRFNVGDKIKVFGEAGGYGDIVFLSKRSGTMHTSFPDENNQPVYEDFPIDEKAGLKNAIGIYGGIGVRIPLSAFEIVIRSQYRYSIPALYSYMDNIYNRYWCISAGIKMKY